MKTADSSILEVCIVEDETRLRALLVREVAAMGHCSEGFHSAEAAWERIREGVDVVLLDLNLPGMTGMSLLEQIREHELEPAVIILTGFGGFDSAVQSLRHRAEDYLTKPCSLADIDRVLARVLARKQESTRRRTLDAKAHQHRSGFQVKRPTSQDDDRQDLQTVEAIERAHILSVLDAHGADKRAAAAALGISLRTLYYKLNAYRQQGFID